LKSGVLDRFPSSSNSHRDDDFVFVGITKLVQSPKKIIPSFVWLKRNHQVKDFFREVFGLTPYATFYFIDGIPKGEMRVFPFGFGGYPDGVPGLVESGTQAVECVRGNAGQGDWHGLGQLDFMKILSSIRVLLDDVGVWVTVEERNGFPVKLHNASLGVVDATT
jgi:hypothetical protein